MEKLLETAKITQNLQHVIPSSVFSSNLCVDEIQSNAPEVTFKFAVTMATFVAAFVQYNRLFAKLKTCLLVLIASVHWLLFCSVTAVVFNSTVKTD